MKNLSEISKIIRKKIIQLSFDGSSPHLGSCLSCVDILVYLYCSYLNINKNNASDGDRDRFILSKGHAAMALYSMLNYIEIISNDELKLFNKNGGILAEHPPANIISTIEAATGSLGHGLPIGAGIALSAKINKKNFITVVLVSDGELNEGSSWEAILFASANKLDNLVVIVDYNKWQATGRSNEVLQLAPLAEKFLSFGWDVKEINGHNFNEIQTSLKLRIKKKRSNPLVIVANTIKGKGISFMEDDNNWHYRIPNDTELQQAFEELNTK